MRTEFEAALRALREGGLVVYPTDTVYGIGCDASNPSAIKRLRGVKGLPSQRGVSVLFATVDEAKAWTRWTQSAQRVSDAFLPGPVTVILDAASEVPPALLAEEGTIAVRNVDASPAVRLARTRPVVATSANRHGDASSTTLEEARDAFGRDVDAYVDGGRLTGPASTVVDARGDRPTVIREGPLPEHEILEAN